MADYLKDLGLRDLRENICLNNEMAQSFYTELHRGFLMFNAL